MIVRVLKQFVFDVFYLFYVLFYSEDFEEIKNKKIAIVFLASNSKGPSSIIPFGEFILREPFFRKISEENEIFLVTDKRDFMEIPPFDRYFRKIISMREFIKRDDLFDMAILAQTDLRLPFGEISKKCAKTLSYSHQTLALSPRYWKYISFFPRYVVGRRHELMRAFDSVGIKSNLKREGFVPKINFKKRPKNKSVCFNLLCKDNAKSMQFEEILEIIRIIRENFLEHKIIFIGGPEGKDILKRLGKMNYSENLLGKTSTNGLIKVLSEADLLVTPDTGTAHLAAAMNIPSIILYNPGSCPSRWRPISEKSIQIMVDKNFKRSLSSAVKRVKAMGKNL